MTTLNARIVHLHSAKPGAIPSAEQLGAIGVLAINAADGCGYTLLADGKVVKVFDCNGIAKPDPDAVEGGTF